MNYGKGFPLNYIPSEEDLVNPSNLQELIEAYEVLESLEAQMNKYEPDSNHPCYYLHHMQKTHIKNYIDAIGEYDNSALVKNISYLSKKNGVKIGDLERILGISAGYISRTAKENSGKKMSIDNVWRIGRFFGVELSTLLDVNLEEADSGTEMLVRFMSKLCMETRNNKIRWKNYGEKSKQLDPSLLMLPNFKNETFLQYRNDTLLNKVGRIPARLGKAFHTLKDDVMVCSDIDGTKVLAFVKYGTEIKPEVQEKMNLSNETYYDIFFFEDSGVAAAHQTVFSTYEDQYDSLSALSENLIRAIKDQLASNRIPTAVKNIIASYLN